MTDNLTPDYDMANRFFTALTGSATEPITFQFFNDKDKKAGRPSYRHMKRSSSYAFLHNKQKADCGVYAMVNAGNGKGRSAKDVVKVRALFIDLDGSPREPAANALKPHMMVESSPDRWHLYWLVEDCDRGQFKPIQQAIARKFDGDKACCDLPRVLRVPGFYHLKKIPVMTKLIEVNDFPRYTTQKVIDGLGLEFEQVATTEKPRKEVKTGQAAAKLSPPYSYISPKTGEMIDLMIWAAQNPGFDIVKNLNAKYALGQVIDGKQHITCLFADEHTDTAPDLSTFIVNAAPPDHTSFNIHCMHSHCTERDRLEFLQAMFEKGWLSESILIPPPLELKKPIWVTLQVKEIAAAPEWLILSPDERRIAWDLQFYAWQTDDGTIEDNDWRIAKFLGLTDDQWLEYRKILQKAGWLKKENGRLTNDIVKREFDHAQMAYSKSCAGGRNGGLKTQANRRKQSPP
jgi:hypothetical protein